MEPASTIIKSLGGATKVSRIAGVHRSRVYGWMQPKSVRGTGGIIPIVHAPALLQEAAAIGVALSADDFLPRQNDADAM